MSTPSMPCQVCFYDANSRCSRCKTAYYCFRQHMISDWPRHKRDCKTLASGLDSHVGYPHRVKAVLFPVHGGDPRVVEVAYKLEHWNETHRYLRTAWTPVPS
ncbi:hypothetical protein C8Q74DRAFT_1398470 [Fomes fomentarius]|nr:hypothetical protein C8Q74DRAFT_1398470 [Fomes fomentarius]